MSTVSVAIATYSRPAMVRQAVEAALAQSRPPEEIVVSDDASPDDTLAVLEQLAAAHPSVRIVRQPTNTGGVPNWNAALRETSGEILAWCSDDDRFLNDHLAASLAYLEAHPDVGLVHSGFIDAVETEAGLLQIPRPHRFAEPHRIDRSSLIHYMTRYYDWPFHPSTIVMRRSVWREVGEFDPRYSLADTDWFVRAAERVPVVMLPRHGVLNRRHPGNWSNRVGSARMQQEIFSIVEGAISRRCTRSSFTRGIQRAVWRANVRLRLGLTLRARVRTGYAEAACAAWHQLVQGTGWGLPKLVEHGGERIIRRLCARREPAFDDARQSVSPL